MLVSHSNMLGQLQANLLNTIWLKLFRISCRLKMVQESKASFICCPTRGFQFLNEFHRYDIIARMETFFEDSEYIIERCLYYLYLHIYTYVSKFLWKWNLYHRAGLSDVLHVHWSNKKVSNVIWSFCELVAKSPSRGYIVFLNFLNI